MGSSELVADTSVFIDYLRAKDKKQTTLYKISSTHTIYISAVTLYELLMGATTDEKRKDVQLLTEDIVVLPFDDNVSLQAAEIYHTLRKTNKMIEFRDIFIGATCLVYDLPIKTTNKAHFERITALRIA